MVKNLFLVLLVNTNFKQSKSETFKFLTSTQVKNKTFLKDQIITSSVYLAQHFYQFNYYSIVYFKYIQRFTSKSSSLMRIIT